MGEMTSGEREREREMREITGDEREREMGVMREV